MKLCLKVCSFHIFLKQQICVVVLVLLSMEEIFSSMDKSALWFILFVSSFFIYSESYFPEQISELFACHFTIYTRICISSIIVLFKLSHVNLSLIRSLYFGIANQQHDRFYISTRNIRRGIAIGFPTLEKRRRSYIYIMSIFTRFHSVVHKSISKVLKMRIKYFWDCFCETCKNFQLHKFSTRYLF